MDKLTFSNMFMADDFGMFDASCVMTIGGISRLTNTADLRNENGLFIFVMARQLRPELNVEFDSDSGFGCKCHLNGEKMFKNEQRTLPTQLYVFSGHRPHYTDPMDGRPTSDILTPARYLVSFSHHRKTSTNVTSASITILLLLLFP